jgi:hypothetical protein
MHYLQMWPQVSDPCFKHYITEVVCDGVDRIALAQVRVRILAVANIVMDLKFCKRQEIYCPPGEYPLPKEDRLCSYVTRR